MQNLCVPSKKDRRILGFQRLQAAVRGAVGVVLRWPGEMLGADTGLLQPVLQTLQTICQERAFSGLFAEVEADSRLGTVAEQRTPLPVGQQLLLIAGLDDGKKKMLAERFRIAVLELALGRCQPGGRDQTQHRFAAVGRVLQGVLPALPQTKTIFHIDIEENIVPAVVGQPSLQCDGFPGIVAVVADEYRGHAPCSGGGSC